MEGAVALRVDGAHAEEESWCRQRLAAVGVPPDMHEFLKEIVSAGDATVCGCRDTAEVLEIREADLVPEASGLVDSSKFIADAIADGVHCRYF